MFLQTGRKVSTTKVVPSQIQQKNHNRMVCFCAALKVVEQIGCHLVSIRRLGFSTSMLGRGIVFGIWMRMLKVRLKTTTVVDLSRYLRHLSYWLWTIGREKFVGRERAALAWAIRAF